MATRKPLQVGRKIYNRSTGKTFVITGVRQHPIKSSMHYEYLIKPYGGKQIKMPILDDILHRIYKLSK